MIVTKEKIHIWDNWIDVDGLGRIGMYSPSQQAILLDYSMKWIVGTNERIYSSSEEGNIKVRILELFNSK